MLFALRQPSTLLGLVLGFAVSMIVLTAVQARIAGIKRGFTDSLHPRTWIDPYSGVAALLGGFGWAPRPEVRRGFGRSQQRTLWALAAAAIVVPLVFAAAGLAAYLANGGSRGFLKAVGSVDFIRGSYPAPSHVSGILLGFSIECIALSIASIVPIPPLATGVAVWTQFPKSPGARQSAYRVLEEQWGIGILMLLMLPIFNLASLLVVILGPLFDDILHAI
jgi:hypothetical protein